MLFCSLAGGAEGLQCLLRVLVVLGMQEHARLTPPVGGVVIKESDSKPLKYRPKGPEAKVWVPQLTRLCLGGLGCAVARAESGAFVC